MSGIPASADKHAGSERGSGERVPTRDPSTTDRRRRRLAPAARIELILDAALQQFASRGFEATRMDDIAAGAGLSKGGLYAHFPGKEQIFQALLDRSLPDVVVDEKALAACTSIRELVETLVDPFYEAMKDPKALVTLRLLVTESARASALVSRWRARLHGDHFGAFRRALEPWIARAAIRESVVLDEGWLAFTPALQPLAVLLLCGASPSADELQRVRSAHVRMLCELLEAPAAASSGLCSATRRADHDR